MKPRGTETTLNRLLPKLTQKHFLKSHETHQEGKILVFENVDILSFCCKFFLTNKDSSFFVILMLLKFTHIVVYKMLF